jgi:hypothetical protein
MVYLHRITDPRMSGSAQKTLEIFKLLTGFTAMPIVRLVTTRWNEVDMLGPDVEKAYRLEDQLRGTDKFWGGMIRDGAVTLRHYGDARSAQAVIASLLENKVEPLPKLAIVREMLDEKRTLPDTAAGRFLDRDNDELRRHYEKEMEKLKLEREQAEQDKDHELAEALAAEEQEYQHRRETMLAAKAQLNVDLHRLHDQVYARSQKKEAQPPPDGDASSATLRSENQLLHYERTQLEDRLVRADRQHRVDTARLQAAMAHQTEQQRIESQRVIHQMVMRHDDESHGLRDELRRLRRKNKKLRARGHSLFDLLMGS